MKALEAIKAISAELATAGIGKDKKNMAQGYSFRGIDDVLQALAPLLPKHGLIILPRVLSCRRDVETNAKGTKLFYVTVDVEYELAAAEDGSSVICRMAGEAMDSGDKATNKAMSAAYKYMALQVFCIPVVGVMIDSEQDSHEAIAPPALLSSNKAMLNTVLALIDEVGSNAESICKHYGVDSLPDLTLPAVDNLILGLNKKKLTK